MGCGLEWDAGRGRRADIVISEPSLMSMVHTMSRSLRNTAPAFFLPETAVFSRFLPSCERNLTAVTRFGGCIDG